MNYTPTTSQIRSYLQGYYLVLQYIIFLGCFLTKCQRTERKKQVEERNLSEEKQKARTARRGRERGFKKKKKYEKEIKASMLSESSS